MKNELFISNLDEIIRLEKRSNGELIVQATDYTNDEFVIMTLTADQKTELRDWLNDGSSGKTFSERNGR